MIPELGHLSLITAFVIAVLQCLVSLWGAHIQSNRLISIAKPAASMQFILIFLAFVCLIYSFVNNDFSVLNVAENSNASLPEIYRVCASFCGRSC